MIRSGMPTRYLMLIVGLLVTPGHAQAQAACSASPLAVQVLGSGGLFSSPSRAAASYLIWRTGRPIVMVGAGEGSLQKLIAAGATVGDLEALVIGRADPDHTEDLALILERAAAERDRPLLVFGPEAGGAFTQLVGAARPDSGPAVVVELVPWRAPSSAWTIDTDAHIDAKNVPHGSWQDPADQSVAYRVRVGDNTLVFGGDQNGTLGAFLDFVDDAELLVMHLALSEEAEPALREFHAWPSIVARVARQAAVHRLLVSQIVDAPPNHPTRSSLSGPVLQASVQEMRFTYSGPIEVASDLLCIPLN